MKLLSRFKRNKTVNKNIHHFLPPIYNRGYESATSQLLRDVFTGGNVDEIIEGQSSAILRRAREAYANNDYVKGYISQACTNIIGHQGIRIQCKTKQKRLNDLTEAAFNRWARKGNCDVSGSLSFIDIQLLCVRSLLRDGEFFIIKHVIDGQLQLQLIDNSRIDVTKRATLANGKKIINGIEVTRFGRPIAYYLTDDTESTQRIPAKNVIHGFISEYVGQKRGISSIATALIRLGLLKEFETSAVDNARSNAKSVGFLNLPENEIDYNALADRDDNTYDNSFEMKAVDDRAQFHLLKPGYKLSTFNSQFPSTTFAPFKESILKAISSSLGYGINYINLGNDLSNVNYSSARQGLLNERDAWRMLQTLIIDSLVRPVFESWLEVEYLSGRLGNISEITFNQLIDTVKFQTRNFPWIDPLKDAKGTTENINNKTTSTSQEIINAGGDVEEIYAQQIADAEHQVKLNKILSFTTDTEQVTIQKQINEGVDDAELLKDD
ncbi:MAG: phage portal protein [Gammaproteobacteria bacterium]|nr:MAG: phage portal protein [Gammaproteobacteria bacterium]UTW43257.1 phage portal protein [bacterium SCSIO 12844]